jgi:hypothetical protein
LGAFCADLPVAPVSSRERAPQVLAPARTRQIHRGELGHARPLGAAGVARARPPTPPAGRPRSWKPSESRGTSPSGSVGAGLPSLVPHILARGGCSFFKNAKAPTCAPRPGWAGGQPSRAHQHAFFAFLLWWLEGASLRGRRSHSRPPNSHLLCPRVAGRDFPPGNTSGSLRRCCLEQCLEGGGRKALRPLGHTFSFTPFRARPRTHLQLSPNPNPTYP